MLPPRTLFAIIAHRSSLVARHSWSPIALRSRERLYFEEVDLLLKRFKKELTMLYIRYRLPPKGGGLRPKLWKQYCWEGFVNDANLIDDTLSIQQSLLSFAQSRMMVADEIAQWAKYETMTFVDFLEALGRVADMKSWPSVADVNAMVSPRGLGRRAMAIGRQVCWLTPRPISQLLIHKQRIDGPRRYNTY